MLKIFLKSFKGDNKSIILNINLYEKQLFSKRDTFSKKNGIILHFYKSL